MGAGSQFARKCSVSISNKSCVRTEGALSYDIEALVHMAQDHGPSGQREDGEHCARDEA
jgi:hypothetical protein